MRSAEIWGIFFLQETGRRRRAEKQAWKKQCKAPYFCKYLGDGDGDGDGDLLLLMMMMMMMMMMMAMEFKALTVIVVKAERA